MIPLRDTPSLAPGPLILRSNYNLKTVGTSVALIAGLSASVALADGYGAPAGYAVVPYVSWTGFYIGGHVGGAWSEVDWSNVTFHRRTVQQD